MKTRRYWVQLIIFFLFLTPAALSAKEWDPRLFETARLVYSGDWMGAVLLIDGYVAENPEDPNGLIFQGTVLEWKGQLTGKQGSENPKILGLYKKANQLAFQQWHHDPKNIDKMINLGNSYIFLGKKHAEMGSGFSAVLTSKKAQKHLEAALKADPSRVDGLWLLGAFHYMADNVPPSLAAFKGLLGIRGSKAQGLEELRRSVSQEHPYYLDVKYTLLYIYTDLEKNYPEAVRIATELENQFPENPEMVRKRAQVEAMHDKLQGANSFLKQVEWCRAKGEKCNSFYFFTGYLDAGEMYKALGKYGQAREMFAQALKYDNGMHPGLTAQAHYGSGIADAEEKKYEEAINNFVKAKSVRHVPKGLKKQIENSMKQVCQAAPSNTNC